MHGDITRLRWPLAIWLLVGPTAVLAIGAAWRFLAPGMGG